MAIIFAKPVPIHSELILHEFDSGNVVLNDWLRKRALNNEKIHASRTFVVCENKTVIGYYSLAVGSVYREFVTSQLRRNMPDPIPVMVLARLAIDIGWQAQGLGSRLVKDAVLKTCKASQYAGIKAILVHAIDQQAVKFYKAKGFHSSSGDERMLMLSLQEVKRSIASKVLDKIA